MSTVNEIKKLEDGLVQAELAPDAEWFEKHLADDAIMVHDGNAAKAKKQVVEAHRGGKGPKFTDVSMTNMEIIDHGNAAVVTCEGAYSHPDGVHKLKFMRIWAKKKNHGWQIIAGSIAPGE
jgi:uncharacterized protein (TIGR02246 family)